MKKTLSRTLSLLLALAMVISLLAVPVSAATWDNVSETRYASRYVTSNYTTGKFYDNMTKIPLTGDGARDVVAVAASQVGYIEGSSASGYNGETGGSNNYTEYGCFLGLTGGSGHAWCAAFCAWSFYVAEVTDLQGSQYDTDNGGNIWADAYVPYWSEYLIEQGRYRAAYQFRNSYSDLYDASYVPQPGDLVFFYTASGDYPGWEGHIGLVAYSDGTYVYTLEGNTSSQDGVESEGGGAFFKKYSLTGSNLVGFGVMPYETVDGLPEIDYTGANPSTGLYVTVSGAKSVYQNIDDSTASWTLPMSSVFEVQDIATDSDGNVMLYSKCEIDGTTVYGWITHGSDSNGYTKTLQVYASGEAYEDPNDLDKDGIPDSYGVTIEEDGTRVFDNCYGFTFKINDTNGTIDGEDATLITTASAYSSCNPNWAISVQLRPTGNDNEYAVVKVVACPGSASAAGITLEDGDVILVVHSADSQPGTYANWKSKVAAVALKEGDILTFNASNTTATVSQGEAVEPEVTEPEVTEPEVTEPEVTEPEVTEPEVTEPEVTEPEVTEPEVTEPEVTQPAIDIPDYGGLIPGAGQQGYASNLYYGVDISYHNVNDTSYHNYETDDDSGADYSLLDFEAMKASGCDYVIIRIGSEDSYGRFIDPHFKTMYNLAREAGMDIGLYYYSLALTYAEAVEDAEYVLDYLNQYDFTFEYPVYIDIEEEDQLALSTTELDAIAYGWCDTMVDAGYFPGIYTGYYASQTMSTQLQKDYDMWIAAYGSTTPANDSLSDICSMWQYTSTGTGDFDGIGKDDIDLNVCYKDYPAIIKAGGYNNFEGTVTEPTEPDVTDPTNPDADGDGIPDSYGIYVEDGIYILDNSYGFVFEIDDVNGTIEGEDATLITTSSAYNSCNPNWAISVQLRPTDDGNYEVVKVVECPGSASAAGISLQSGDKILVVHSAASYPGNYANWLSKIAAVALKEGDIIEISSDNTTATVIAPAEEEEPEQPTEPEVTEPEVTEPEVTEPEVTEPEVTEPEVTEPEVTEPEVTEPEVTEPEVTEPEVTEPEVTEPEVTEPEVTEPEVTEPEVTEPAETEPVETEPVETEPAIEVPNYGGAIPGAGIPGTLANPAPNFAMGVDLSFYNVNDTDYRDYITNDDSGADYSLVDFEAMKASGCDFVILRMGASDDSGYYTDPHFYTYYNLAREAGMDIGVYFYSYAMSTAEAIEEAEYVIDVLDASGMYFEYPIYIDIEESSQIALGSSTVSAIAKAWCETMYDNGYFPGIYGAYNLFNILTTEMQESYDLWLAYISNTDGSVPTPETDNISDDAGVWQFTFEGQDRFDGIGLDMMDVNVSYKDYASIMKAYGYNNYTAANPDTPDEGGDEEDDTNPDKDGDGIPDSYGVSVNEKGIYSFENSYGYTFTIDDVNGTIEGEDATIITTSSAYSSCNPNWAISVHLRLTGTSADEYYVVKVVECPGSASAANITLEDGDVILVVHSAASYPGNYANWMSKIAAVALKEGDIIEIASDNSTATVMGPAEEEEPEVTEPEVTEPEVTEPEVTEPEVTEPEVTEPEVTEPEVTEPEVTEPEVTEPEVTDPDADGDGILDCYGVYVEDGIYAFTNSYGYVFDIDDVNGTIGGEDATIITTASAYSSCNPNWAISVQLRPTDDGKYQVVKVVECPGSASAAGISLQSGDVIMVVHSAASFPGDYANWMDKIAAVALKKGDIVEIAADNSTVTVISEGVLEETEEPEVTVPDTDIPDYGGAIPGAGIPGSASNLYYGCDVSFYNVSDNSYANYTTSDDSGADYSLLDFAKMKADGCDFVILRMGSSDSSGYYTDPHFFTLYNMARAAGMDIGLYFYSYAMNKSEAIAEANYVISVLEANDMYFEYPIYIDIEESDQLSLGQTTLDSICYGWCETLYAAGYYPGIYGNYNLYDAVSSDIQNDYDFWVAWVSSATSQSAYNPSTNNISNEASMWQYSFYGYEYDGVGLDMLDVNVSYKDYPAIMATYGYNNVK